MVRELTKIPHVTSAKKNSSTPNIIRKRPMFVFKTSAGKTAIMAVQIISSLVNMFLCLDIGKQPFVYV